MNATGTIIEWALTIAGCLLLSMSLHGDFAACLASAALWAGLRGPSK